MIQRLRASLANSAAAFQAVFANPALRRLQLALVGSVTGQWSYLIAIAVLAYESGGAAAVGIVALVRMIPAAVAAPFAGILGDRYSRRRVMMFADGIAAGSVAAMAALTALDAPVGIVFGLAALVSITGTAFRPAQAALLPTLARSPAELTAANTASSTIESVGAFAGPALGGILLAVTSGDMVFVFAAAAFAWSALLLSGLEPDSPARSKTESGSTPWSEATAGLRAIGGDAKLRLLVGLYTAQTFVAGALDVLIVVMALRLLETGEAGVGWFYAAVGIGGLVGAVATFALMGRRRLAGDFGIGIVLWGGPIVLIGVWPNPTLALILLGVIGIGNTIVDVAALTLMQRAVADEILARVFGVFESLIIASIGLGAIVAPALVAGLDVRGALIVVGALLPALALLTWRRLARIDAEARIPERELELLRAIPLFSPLPGATLEHLALSLEPIEAGVGETIVRKGEAGDRFYVIGSGEVEVVADAEATSRLGPGDFFGEIALLRSVPRTATVTARERTELFALDRDEFVAAVTGHPVSAEAADAVIGTRLRSLRGGVASI